MAVIYKTEQNTPPCPLCGGEIKHDDLQVYEPLYLVLSNKKVATLTNSEMAIFMHLYSQFGRVVSHHNLMNTIEFESGGEADENLIKVFVCKLRAKLIGMNIEVATSWGNGYLLKNKDC